MIEVLSIVWDKNLVPSGSRFLSYWRTFFDRVLHFN